MRFVCVTNMRAWIRATGPERIITDLVDELEVDFRRWERFEREPRMTLPFLSDDFDRIAFADDLGYR